jgi:hypothetical protein
VSDSSRKQFLIWKEVLLKEGRAIGYIDGILTCREALLSRENRSRVKELDG